MSTHIWARDRGETYDDGRYAFHGTRAEAAAELGPGEALVRLRRVLPVEVVKPETLARIIEERVGEEADEPADDGWIRDWESPAVSLRPGAAEALGEWLDRYVQVDAYVVDGEVEVSDDRDEPPPGYTVHTDRLVEDFPWVYAVGGRRVYGSYWKTRSQCIAALWKIHDEDRTEPVELSKARAEVERLRIEATNLRGALAVKQVMLDRVREAAREVAAERDATIERLAAKVEDVADLYTDTLRRALEAAGKEGGVEWSLEDVVEAVTELAAKVGGAR